MRRHRRPEMVVPTASMGDIAFLLTIFFMICSNMAKEGGINLKPPRAPESSVVNESRLSVAVDENGRIHVQGRPIADAAALEAVMAQVLEGKTTELGRTVMFKCDQNVDKSIFEPVIEAIVKSGGIIVAVGETGAATDQKREEGAQP
jgi:biopolymer transport protein ExbD